MSVDINCPLPSRLIQNANDLRKTANCPTAKQNISGVKNSRFLFSKEKASNSPVTVTSPCFQTVLSNQHHLGSCNYTTGNNTSTVKVQPDTPMSTGQWSLGSGFPKTSHGSNRCSLFGEPTSSRQSRNRLNFLFGLFQIASGSFISPQWK